MRWGHEPTILHLDRWSQEHLGRHDSPGFHAYHRHLRELIESKILERQAEHDNEGLFGMSKAGGCVRAACLARSGAPRKPITGSDAVTFELGHVAEVMVIAVLRAAGFTVDGLQQRVRLDGIFSSAVDGILTAGPVTLPYPVVLSVKSAGYKMGKPGQRRGFAALPVAGIRAEQPSWWVQSQLEMAALGSEDFCRVFQTCNSIPKHALVVVLAKDVVKAYEGDKFLPSLAWYAELLDHDLVASSEISRIYQAAATRPADEAAAAWNNGAAWCFLPAPGDVASGWGGVNQKATGRYNPCFGCDFADPCADAEMNRRLAASLEGGRVDGDPWASYDTSATPFAEDEA